MNIYESQAILSLKQKLWNSITTQTYIGGFNVGTWKLQTK